MGIVLLVSFVGPFLWKAAETGKLALWAVSLVLGIPLLVITVLLFRQRLTLTATPAELIMEESSFGSWSRRSARIPRPQEVSLSLRPHVKGGAFEWVLFTEEGEITGIRTEKKKIERDMVRVRDFLEHEGIEVRQK